MTPTELVNALIKKQGKDGAKKVISESLASASVANDLYLYTEAEWTLGTKGLEIAKTNRRSGAKTKREKKNLAFWTEAANIFNKI